MPSRTIPISTIETGMTTRVGVLVAVLSLSILAVPFVGEAQYKAGKVPRVGILNSDAAQDARVSEFRDGLRELGYVEGQNLAITYRWADGRVMHVRGLVQLVYPPCSTHDG